MNYDMTFCTGQGSTRGSSKLNGAYAIRPCPLRDTCERYMRYEDRPKNRPLSWFMDPPFEGETCEYHMEKDDE